MPGSDNHWYGNGPKPENRFYGALKEGSDNADLLIKLQREVERKRIELLKMQYPTLGNILDEIKKTKKDLEDAQDGVDAIQRDLDRLEEEKAILEKLYGIDNGNNIP